MSSTRAQAIASILAKVKSMFAAIDVDVVAARPAAGATFSMIMVGGHHILAPLQPGPGCVNNACAFACSAQV